MLTWLQQAKHLIRFRTRVRTFRTAPRLFREHVRYALRLAARDEFKLSLWFTVPGGARFFLSADPIDDAIVQDMLSQPERLFPKASELGGGAGVILDVGGHHGLYAAEALRRYPDRKLIVVEPHPTWCDLIRKNVAGNGGVARVRVVSACLAADRATRTLRFDPESSWGATVESGGDDGVAMEVQSLPLPDILEGQTVAMVYCNAEGAEYTLVPQLRQHGIRPAIMVICVHPEYGDAEQLRLQVQEMGYIERDASASPQRPVFHYKFRAAL